MRGENVPDSHEKDGPWGSSPHARGKLNGRGHAPTPNGLIPACAGKTNKSRVRHAKTPAHPRMRGENAVEVHDPVGVWGSSPHARGKRVEF